INAVIVVGDPQVIKGIKVMLDELDKEKYQVYVQAQVININKKNAKSLGVKWGFDGAALGSDGGLYSLSTAFGGVSIPNKTVLDQFINVSKTSSGFALGAALSFLETNGASKSISNPSILCVNNKESSIYVGKTISISTGSTLGTAGLPTTSYKREDVGLTLKIKPRVSSQDKVTLEVETILENVTDNGLNSNGEPVRQPETAKQEVKTQTILRHGESIIIGGLVKTYDNNAITKIPLLGDIPLLGEYLFSSSDKSVEEDNLVVILTPYVIDNSENLSRLQEELGVLSAIQTQYNVEVFANLEKRKEEKENADQSKVNPFGAVE
ncbi:MAG: hypothetical protein WBK95_04550, partial [Sulfurimonas sp.]